LTDNGIQILYTDGSYETRGTPSNNSTTSTDITGTPKGFTQDDIQKGAELFKQYGQGGYAHPAFYVDAYQNWINTGGKASKFLELYPPEMYVAPKDADLVPTFLQPKKVKKTTTDTEDPLNKVLGN
jgi:hypothetical protein